MELKSNILCVLYVLLNCLSCIGLSGGQFVAEEFIDGDFKPAGTVCLL